MSTCHWCGESQEHHVEGGLAEVCALQHPDEPSDESFEDEDCTCPGDDIDTFCPIHGKERDRS
jgi:hypothetical protein